MKKKLLALSVLSAITTQAGAFQFDTSEDWNIRWDNTVKANLMARVAKQDKDVYSAAHNPASYFLADDSDRSVDRSNLGIVSSRLDVLSELDVIWKNNFGFRISGSAWYDAAYDDSDHPDTRATWASPSVKPGEYPDDAEDLHYAGGELLDAFVFANFTVGDVAAVVRAGRHTIYWGQSLLSSGAVHGVAGAMAPLDFSKAFSVPGTEAKELFMPTAKISTVVQLTYNLTLNAYYSFAHRPYRLPATTTYFSPVEGLTEDTEFITLVPGEALRVGLDMQNDKTENGDFGFNLQYYIEPWGLETSFIYINYTDMIQNGLMGGIDFGQFAAVQAQGGSQSAAQLLQLWGGSCVAGGFPCPTPPVVDPRAGTVTVGNARWLYKDDIDVFGISLSKEMFGISFGMDLVYRQDMALAPQLGTSLQRVNGVPAPFAGFVPNKDWDYAGASSGNYLNATGDTWAVVINGLGLLNGDWGLWDGGSYIVEAVFSGLDKCNSYCDDDPNPQDRLMDARIEEGRVISQIAAVFKPTWYQVFPGWDLSVPMSVSYTIDGEKAAYSYGGDEEGGNGSIGVEFDIEQKWLVSAKYNAFFGPAQAGIGGLLKDRDNISLTVKMTF